MKFSDIKNETQLWEFMTTPTDRLIESVRSLDGPVIVLGGSGKMGVELVALLRQADKALGRHREIFVASTFSDPSGLALRTMKELGITTFRGDLSHPPFLSSLPVVPNVVYMMGFKFGSSKDWQRAFHLNSIVPYLVGQHFSRSKIIVFSSGNPYPKSAVTSKGSKEEDPMEPSGIYGWSIVSRESSFRITAQQHSGQKLCFYRLMYAQHFYYGVLVDLARMIVQGEAISLAMPAVNLVSQRDANEIALRSFDYCNNDPRIFNVAGPAWPVRKIVGEMEKHLEIKAVLKDDEGDLSLLADDSLCVQTFGTFLDEVEDMIEGVANWVKSNGAYWNKPTYFGRANRNY